MNQFPSSLAANPPSPTPPSIGASGLTYGVRGRDGNFTTRFASANFFTQCLGREFEVVNALARESWFQRLCCPRNENPDGTPPWQIMPPNGRRLRVFNSTTVGALDGASLNTDVLVMEHRVPIGYECVVAALVNQYTGPDLIEGSGVLVWRLQFNSHWVKDYGVINTTMGSAAQPWPLIRGGLRVRQHSWIRYYARLTASGVLDPAQRVVCGIQGWEYPNQ